MRPLNRRAGLLLGGAAIAGLPFAHDARAEDDNAIPLDTVTISATRTQGAAVDALASESVVTDEVVKLQEASRISDVLRSVPGVAVQEVADSPAAAINIRGLQGFGRVAVTIDGARQNFQASGHSLGDGSFFFEPEFLDTATIVRGPVANLYGSGAIGGVVSFETKRPSTFLEEGQRWALESFSQYDTNNGFALGLTGARRFTDTFSALGGVVYRNNWNYEDGNGDQVFNSGNEIAAGLLKAEVDPGNGHSLVLGAVTNYSEYRSGDPASTNYDNEVADNTLTATYRFQSPDHDWLDFAVSTYWTNTDLDQTYLTGALAGNDRNFRIDTVGFDVNNTARFDTGILEHALTVGTDAFFDDVEVTDAVGTGALFTPNGERTVYGAFVQDAVGYSDWLEVIGALRFDGYDLDGGGNSSSGQRVSPKITVGVSPFETTTLHGIQLYSTYAEGYRAPSITETLIAGTHPFPAFDILPNPDLRPETAHTIEAGLNVSRDDLFAAGDRLRMKAAVFRNDVDDFIDIGVVPCPGFCMQYQNIANARIEGVELEINYDAGWAFVGIAGQHQRGEDRQTGAPLDSIPADKLVTTLGFRALEDKAIFGIQWEAVAAQDRVTVTPPSDAYNVVNLFADYSPRDDLTLGLNVDNLFNEDYTPYLDSDPSAGLAVKFTLRTRLGG
ncbi:TonB-dependent hemoglobin/transferrin/lactoferrin family receptor [Stappia sp. F7233]|uniref:TonB-dependent hemoglobin/transferrin/lactoferrin family receptor n=1 Tax=Stappia albiluteola TaxID=2758565 RepID=A0A839A9U5_9HYPH|nr:TonB-dependent hemoglobin/transferrin/lactoferrin family receptor [Stappia albiluteola]MBA5776171.1 TonB-dependent hemoglobin/transferrin/lactoferrin family receptor [Stappia albiluteola]